MKRRSAPPNGPYGSGRTLRFYVYYLDGCFHNCAGYDFFVTMNVMYAITYLYSALFWLQINSNIGSNFPTPCTDFQWRRGRGGGTGPSKF